MNAIPQSDIGRESVTGTEINPAVVTETKNVAFFEVRVMSLELFKSVSVMVMLKDAGGKCVSVRNFTIHGDEYFAWNNDDTYLINLVAERLGFTLKA